MASSIKTCFQRAGRSSGLMGGVFCVRGSYRAPPPLNKEPKLANYFVSRGGSRADGAGASLRRSIAIAASAKQPPLVGAARVIGGHDGIARLHHALTHETSRLIPQCLQLAFESLKILLPKEISALDFCPNRFDQLQVIGRIPVATSARSRAVSALKCSQLFPRLVNIAIRTDK